MSFISYEQAKRADAKFKRLDELEIQYPELADWHKLIKDSCDRTYAENAKLKQGIRIAIDLLKDLVKVL